MTDKQKEEANKQLATLTLSQAKEGLKMATMITLMLANVNTLKELEQVKEEMYHTFIMLNERLDNGRTT